MIRSSPTVGNILTVVKTIDAIIGNFLLILFEVLNTDGFPSVSMGSDGTRKFSLAPLS